MPAGFSSGWGVGARGGGLRGVSGKNPSGFASLSHLPFQGRLLACFPMREPPLKGEVSPQATEGLRPRKEFLLECLAFDHACLFSFVRKRETACGRLRFYSAVGRDRLSAFSDVAWLSGLDSSFWD